jgi:recombinational DNA repair ATPase RecF
MNHSDITARLAHDATLAPEAKGLVTAALGGAAGEAAPEQAGEPAHDPADDDSTSGTPAGGVFLKRLKVQGFRGIGSEVTLDLQPTPGLTVIAGRNGSGKSSLAEGLEVALTGTSYRWKKRAAQWQGSWRNMHRSPPTIEATAVQSTGETIDVRVEWDDDANLSEQRTTVTRGGSDCSLAELGWSTPLATSRPLLTYEELGTILTDTPSALHDALSRMLGLDDVAAAVRSLGEQKKYAALPKKELSDARAALTSRLEAITDPRAATALSLASARTPDPAALREVAAGVDASTLGRSAGLRDLVALQVPDRASVQTSADRLRGAVSRLASLADDGVAALERRLAVLGAALTAHEHEGDMTCPACGVGQIDAARAAQVATEAEAARATLGELTAARAELADARQRARAVVAAVPRALHRPTEGAVEEFRVAALEAWQAWAALPDDDLALADHVTGRCPTLAEAVDRLQGAAAADAESLDEQWAQVAGSVAAFADVVERWAAAKPTAAHTAAAHKWLQDQEIVLKNERIAPIAEQAARIWELLRQESNVEISGIALHGANTRRKVEIKAEVDGVESGIAVLSQGELHALSLALFLPRATLDSSPFRFVVLDDPVQAMDPAKVDGLVVVLGEIAEKHQVIVFSHDDRLSAAVRRSAVPATVLEVTRGSSSAVSIANTYTPARRYLQDAAALVKDEHLPDVAMRRVLPGLLRMAVEAQARDRYFVVGLGAGHSHVDLEKTWDTTHTTRKRVALALGLADIADWERNRSYPFRTRALTVTATAVHAGLDGEVGRALAATSLLVDELARTGRSPR